MHLRRLYFMYMVYVHKRSPLYSHITHQYTCLARCLKRQFPNNTTIEYGLCGIFLFHATFCRYPLSLHSLVYTHIYSIGFCNEFSKVLHEF